MSRRQCELEGCSKRAARGGPYCTARLRLVAAALFAVLWTLTVWTVGHPRARASTPPHRELPAADSRGVPTPRLVHPRNMGYP
jgi:hypothetical protein